jgi:hypothetical protein
LAVFNERVFQQAEVVSFGAKIADMFALIARFTDRHVHFRTGIAVKTVAFNLGGVQINWAKILRNARLVVVVPAPLEPVTAITGCLADITTP